MTYEELVNAYRDHPKEIPTAPINGSRPKWFYVYTRGEEVYAASGRTHSNPCRIFPDRRLEPDEFSKMVGIYLRRKRGEPVSREAGDGSVNASYWFGIFKDLSV